VVSTRRYERYILLAGQGVEKRVRRGKIGCVKNESTLKRGTDAVQKT